MSVPSYRRNTSSIDYVYLTRQLEIYTIKKSVSLPKRYTTFVIKGIIDNVVESYNYVSMAGTLVLKSIKDYEIQRDYLNAALSRIYALVSQIEVAIEIIDEPIKSVDYWMKLVSGASSSIKAALENNRVGSSKCADNDNSFCYVNNQGNGNNNNANNFNGVVVGSASKDESS